MRTARHAHATDRFAAVRCPALSLAHDEPGGTPGAQLSPAIRGKMIMATSTLFLPKVSFRARNGLPPPHGASRQGESYDARARRASRRWVPSSYFCLRSRRTVLSVSGT
jgi:hypothetical protein